MRPGKLLDIQQQLEQQLSSLREAQRDLLDQFRAARSGDMDSLQSGWLRLNIAQVNQCIEDLTLHLASIHHQVEEKAIRSCGQESCRDQPVRTQR